MGIQIQLAKPIWIHTDPDPGKKSKSKDKKKHTYEAAEDFRKAGNKAFLNFGIFPCFWIRIRIPNTDPDPRQKWMRKQTDPDPQHCYQGMLSVNPKIISTDTATWNEKVENILFASLKVDHQSITIHKRARPQFLFHSHVRSIDKRTSSASSYVAMSQTGNFVLDVRIVHLLVKTKDSGYSLGL